MSGHCDFCGIWHSGGCCHPARQTVAALEARVRELEAERDALRAVLREAQDRSVYLAAPATDDHSISLRERIDAFLVWEKK